MSRVPFVAAGVAAIVASYLAVIFGLAPAESIGPVTIASIALPALVSGLVVTGFIAIVAKGAHDAASKMHDLHAQIARKEVELTRLTTHDELTGLYSRSHFDEALMLEYERAKRHGRPFALLLVQIDDLEAFVERAGSVRRGYVLSEVAALVRTMLRVNDIGCRYMDDALAVLLPETEADGANIVAERLRTQLSKREFFGRGKPVASSLTISQGIVCFPCAGISSHYDLLKAGETALVEAKSLGGGCVRAYGQNEPPATDDPADRTALAS